MYKCLFFMALLVGVSACGGGGDNTDSENGISNPPAGETGPGEVGQPGRVTDPSDGAPPSNIDFSVNFPDKTLWGDAVSYTAFNEQHKSEVASVAYGPQGQVCYILKEAQLEDSTIWDYLWDSTLQCIDAQGNETIDFARTGLGIIKDVIFTPEGNIVLADFVERDPDRPDDSDLAVGFFLRFTLFSSATGEVLQQKLLTDMPTEEELYFYDVEDGVVTREAAPNLVDDGKPVLLEPADFAMQWQGGALYVMTYTYGVKLYRLSTSFETVWDVQVMPAYSYLWTDLLQNVAAFTVNEQGEAYVAFELYDEDMLIYERHFGRTLNTQVNPDGNSSIGVSVFDSNGQYQRSFLAGVPEYSEQLVAVGFQNNRFWIGGNVRHDKFEHANRTEWDLLLMQYSAADDSILDYDLIHHDQGDLAYGVKQLPNGNYLYAGMTGFRQAETNSVVSNGKGMLAEVTQEGVLARTLTMAEPRNVSINAIHAVNNNQILFANTYNGPITHTCDNDESLCYEDAVVGIATFAE